MKKTKKPSNIIDLVSLFSKQAAIERRVQKISDDLAKEKGRLMTFNTKAKENITKALIAGKTAGVPLLNELIQCFGLDKTVIEKIMAFNGKLMSAKGSELLIAISYQKRIRFGGPGDLSDNDFMTCWGYVFGTLSGERLTFDPTSLSMTIPFSRHILHGFEHGKDHESTVGPIIISNHGLEPSTFTILHWLMKEHFETGLTRPIDGLRGTGHQVVILVGDEISYKGLNKTGCMLNLEDLKKRLLIATPQEKGRGDGI